MKACGEVSSNGNKWLYIGIVELLFPDSNIFFLVLLELFNVLKLPSPSACKRLNWKGM